MPNLPKENSSIDEVVDGPRPSAGLRKRKVKENPKAKVVENEGLEYNGYKLVDYGDRKYLQPIGSPTDATLSSQPDGANEKELEKEWLFSDSFSESPGSEAGLRSRRGKKEDLEAKVDEHGRALPKVIDSPISSTGFFQEDNETQDPAENTANWEQVRYKPSYYPLKPSYPIKKRSNFERRPPIPAAWRWDKPQPVIEENENEDEDEGEKSENEEGFSTWAQYQAKRGAISLSPEKTSPAEGTIPGHFLANRTASYRSAGLSPTAENIPPPKWSPRAQLALLAQRQREKREREKDPLSPFSDSTGDLERGLPDIAGSEGRRESGDVDGDSAGDDGGV